MSIRRSSALAALVAIAAIVLSACGVAQAPALTDPKDILTKSVLSLKDVKTLHIDAELSGKVSAGLTGSTSQIDLVGTKGTLDLDIPNKKLKASGSIPALLNSSGEILVLTDAVYYKITGPFGQGDKYTKMALPSTDPSASTAPTDPQKAIDELKAGLDKLPSPPTKLADEKVGDADAYHVQIKLTAAQLQALASTPPTGSLGSGDLTFDVYPRRSDLRPAKIGLTIASPEMGTLTITMTFTYDVGVNVAAPPADQVTEGGGLTLPSMAP
jgi:hypothetical protein